MFRSTISADVSTGISVDFVNKLLCDKTINKTFILKPNTEIQSG